MPETVNAVDAWLGGLPGHVYANVRQPPVSTLNLAHMIPLSAVWAGPERDEHFGAPPLLYGKTEGSTRSEEHTSELQSLMRISYAVFCLKKKTIKITIMPTSRRTHSDTHTIYTSPQTQL